MTMITLTNQRSDTTTGFVTRIWDVVRDGRVVAQLFKSSEPFSKWRINNGAVRETFGNKTSALLFAGTL
jgi:endonuclease YncB( thermonuclease family)